MKRVVLSCAVLLTCLAATAVAAGGPQPGAGSGQHAPAWHDRLDGRTYPLPPTIGGRPAAFYLANPRVSPLAKALYQGRFRPTDNDSTTQLLALAITPDPVIRPFYRWCLSFTIALSDGALGEYTGEPALAYVCRFPQEFFAYTDKDASGARYQEWVAAIAYSGLPTRSSYSQPRAALRQVLLTELTKNCRHCPPALTQRLARLATAIAAAATQNSR